MSRDTGLSSGNPIVYLIDTDLLIYFLHDIREAVSLVDQLVDRGAAMNAVTYMEVLDGLGRGSDPTAEERRLRVLAHLIPILQFGLAEARIAAGLRRSLRDQGRSFRPRTLDIQIAATAISNGLTLVTNNVADYRHLPGLEVEAADLER